MGVLIGVDIGTTKLCAVSLDTDAGTLLAVEDSPNSKVLAAEPDAAEQDAAGIISEVKSMLSRLLARPQMKGLQALAVGVTGQMHGVTLVDDSGAPATPLITWQDRRGNRPFRDTDRTYVEELARRMGTEAVHAAGCAPSTGFGAVTLLRMQEEGRIPRPATALTIHDFFVLSLCGCAVTDPTDAASWGIFDVRDAVSWLPGAREAMGSPNTVSLPQVQPTGSIAGRLLPAAAVETGLPEGIPVSVALGDNQASFLGSVPSLEETALLNLGTGGQMSVPVNKFVRADGLDTRPLTTGHWLLVGASLCGGRSYQVLSEFFRAVGTELFGVTSQEMYDKMNRLADAVEDTSGLQASTLFDGLRSDPTVRGSLTGISSENLTPGNLIRAVTAGMVGELLDYYQIAVQAGATPSYLAGSGNAIRRNAVVRRQIEQQLGLSLRMPPHREEAAVGAALSAGVASGVFKDWREAGKLLFEAEKQPLV